MGRFCHRTLHAEAKPTADEYKAVARERAQHMGWSHLSQRQQAALAHEADKWKDHEPDGFFFAPRRNHGIGDMIEGVLGILRSPHCSFCGKDASEMVEGDTGAMICAACIAAAAKVVAERKARA
jgi:hypothetical protein